MEIAGDYEPPPAKKDREGKKGKGGEKGKEGEKSKEVLPAKRKAAAAECHIKVLGLCI